ncbi:MAG: homocysteine S-methyltransferase [Proteobacteria bacterium]|nr:homocysteine S-methyltransferase [Pseudomonadota bacterium]
MIIDGGLATQLEAQGCNINNPLWSASVIRSNPQAIIDAHRAYLEAGAEIITTASYQATDPEMLRRSVELALQARDEFEALSGRHALVAASIGPYGAVLSDGSEYRGDYAIDADELHDFHRGRLELLDASGADLLACETIPSLTEAIVLGKLLRDADLPSWISFSCRDGECINDGTPIEEVVDQFRDHPRVLAVGINCTPPQYVLALIERIHAVLPDKAIIVYPNLGETFDAASKTWSGTVTANDWAAAAQTWVSAGAAIIGGCCRTGPAHIRAIAGASC